MLSFDEFYKQWLAQQQPQQAAQFQAPLTNWLAQSQQGGIPNNPGVQGLPLPVQTGQIAQGGAPLQTVGITGRQSTPQDLQRFPDSIGAPQGWLPQQTTQQLVKPGTTPTATPLASAAPAKPAWQQNHNIAPPVWNPNRPQANANPQYNPSISNIDKNRWGAISGQWWKSRSATGMPTRPVR